MKQLLLILLLCLSVDATAQTVFKDKRQDLRLERVIQNSQETYKIYWSTNYLVLGNKALTDMFLEEILNVFVTQQTVYTYVGNTAVKYEYFEDRVIVSARGSSFSLSKKQIIKIKKLCLN